MHRRIRRVLASLAPALVATSLVLVACSGVHGAAPQSQTDAEASASGAETVAESPEDDSAEPEEDAAPEADAVSEPDGAAPDKDAVSEPEPEPIDPASLAAGTVVSPDQIASAGGEDAFFWAEEISDQTFARMEGKSFGPDCTVPRENLRYVKVLHVDAEGVTKVGELVVNATVADEVVDIFRQLYDARWPIKKMHLVDDYGGSDDLSCADGNSSAFNFRMAVNANVLSNHSFGLAIDINTFENPYYIPSSGYVYPAEAARYLDRSLDEPYMIHRGDLCYQLFTERGWSWGGDWTNINDFQHFEKP